MTELLAWKYNHRTTPELEDTLFAFQVESIVNFCEKHELKVPTIHRRDLT